mmetsp:Transcript_13217/g.18303  ORF Transcript_13217/g.18303 Transcript_13217/m.18303 type:complete len:87 (+) Transcript_13217:229-489(+)
MASRRVSLTKISMIERNHHGRPCLWKQSATEKSKTIFADAFSLRILSKMCTPQTAFRAHVAFERARRIQKLRLWDKFKPIFYSRSS